jgi:hypothetical protein
LKNKLDIDATRTFSINMALARMDKLVKKLNVEPWVWITPGAAPLRWMELNHNPRWNISGLRVTLSYMYLGENVRVASMSNLFFNLYLVFLNGVPLPCMARGAIVTVKSSASFGYIIKILIFIIAVSYDYSHACFDYNFLCKYV